MTLMDDIADIGATLLMVPAFIGFGMFALVSKIPFLDDRPATAMFVLGLLSIGLGLATGMML